MNMTAGVGDGTPVVMIQVDARHPNRWLEPQWFEGISKIAMQHPGTTVRAGAHWFLLYPLHKVDNPGSIKLAAGAQVIPGRVGPAFRGPGGQYAWIEFVPPAELVDRRKLGV
jgi:hypothetical protein